MKYKIVFTLRAGSPFEDNRLEVDSFQAILWPNIKPTAQAAKAFLAFTGELDKEMKDALDGINFIMLRCRFNTDIYGPFAFDMEADKPWDDKQLGTYISTLSADELRDKLRRAVFGGGRTP